MLGDAPQAARRSLTSTGLFSCGPCMHPCQPARHRVSGSTVATVIKVNISCMDLRPLSQEGIHIWYENLVKHQGLVKSP